MSHTVMSGACSRNRGYVSNRDVWFGVCVLVCVWCGVVCRSGFFIRAIGATHCVGERGLWTKSPQWQSSLLANITAHKIPQSICSNSERVRGGEAISTAPFRPAMCLSVCVFVCVCVCVCV